MKSIFKLKLTDFISVVQASQQFHIPVPLITLLSCGKTSPGKLCLLEEIILVPKTGQKVKQVFTHDITLS